MTEEKEKNEAQILFPDVEIEGEIIRPWSYGQLTDALPAIDAIAKDMVMIGITFENMDARPADVIQAIAPYGPILISITLKKDQKEVRGWPPIKAMRILPVIVEQNAELIKNVFGPSLMGAINRFIAAV